MLSFAFSTRYSSLARTKLFPQAVSSRLSLFCRRYALVSRSDLSVESMANIIRYVRSIEAKGLPVAWRELASTHNLSEVDLKQAVAEDTAERQKQEVLSNKITEAATNPDRFFDMKKGRCNWEALAAEFRLPLVDCLRAFNPAKSPHAVRSMPEPNEWSQEDMAMLFSLIRNTFKSFVMADWVLAGLYMNAKPDSCKSAVQSIKKSRMTPALFEDIQRHRGEGLKWLKIHCLYPYYSAPRTLRSAYGNYKHRIMNTSSSAVWTKADQQRMLELISEHRIVISNDKEHALRLIESEFPHLPEGTVRRRVSNKLNDLRHTSLASSALNHLRQFVSEYGEDWVRIDSELGTPLGSAQYNWDMIKDLKLTEAWSLEDTKRLYHCINVGMSVADSVRYIGTKSPRKLHDMKTELRKQALVRSSKSTRYTKLQWTDEEKAGLFELVAFSNGDSCATWESISNQLGRSITECVYTYHTSHITNWRPSAVSDESKFKVVTQICRDEYMSAGYIDWAKISKLTGLDQRECMEACELDEGKRRWIYNADTFQWDDANRMTDFIKANYPESSGVNYRAVSNYLWVKLEDCIHMHDLLQGKLRWTDDVVDRVTQMRSQGYKFSYIAKQLSPVLRAINANNAYNLHTREREPISEEEKQNIRGLVNKYVGKVPVKEVTERVKHDLASWDSGISHFVASSIKNHQNYKKRLAGMDLTDIAGRISSGKLTIGQAAAELDVTSTALHYVLRKLDARGYSSKWTTGETNQFITYVSSLGGKKPDWTCCAKLVGTKHPSQCRNKYVSLYLA